MSVLDHMSLRDLFDRQDEVKRNIDIWRAKIGQPRNSNLDIKTIHAIVRELEFELNQLNQKLRAVTFVT